MPHLIESTHIMLSGCEYIGENRTYVRIKWVDRWINVCRFNAFTVDEWIIVGGD